MNKETHARADELREEISAVLDLARLTAVATAITAYDGQGGQADITNNFILDRFNDVVNEEVKRLRAEYAAL